MQPPLNSLYTLGNQLAGHGYNTGVGNDDGLYLAVVETPRALIVRVRPRLDDAGRQWFYAGNKALAETTQVVNAVTAIKGLMTP